MWTGRGVDVHNATSQVCVELTKECLPAPQGAMQPHLPFMEELLAGHINLQMHLA